MNLRFFALRGSRYSLRIAPPKRNPAFADLRREHDRLYKKPSATNRTRMVAAWRVSEETGRLECVWTTDTDPDTSGGLSQMIERAGLMLAVYQQGRFAA